MNDVGRHAFLLAALMFLGAAAVRAQDTTVTVHALPLDTSKVRPFQRTYDVIVHRGDSSIVIGERGVSLNPATYAGNAGWLITETRTGVVTAAESLFVSSDFRPLHWSSAEGTARVGIEFVGDSIYGAVASPLARQNVVMAGAPDIVPTATFAEAMMPLLPLALGWTDSVKVMTLDASSHDIRGAELSVIGEEEMGDDASATRPVWLVVLRMASARVLYWVNKDDAAVTRALQPLPAHVGVDLEYRLRPIVPAPAP